MKIEINAPIFPESVTEAVVLDWHKKIGDIINLEENLVDLETDKVILELPASTKGVLTEILAKTGDVVTSGQLIARMDTELATQVNSNQNTTTTANNNINQTDALSTNTTTSNTVANITNNQDILIMPAAKKIAEESQVDLTKIAATGRDGRILKEDLISSQMKSNNNQNNNTNLSNNTISNTNLNHPNATLVSNTSGNIDERVPMSRLRKKIAERLLASQQNNAILTTFNEVDMKPIMDLRAKYKDIFEKKHGTKLGFMSFFLKAVVHAVSTYPILNASIDGDDIVYHNYFDIGVAVSSPRGLVVPIIRNVENLSLAQIELQIADFGKRAKDGKIELSELTGGTFSVTNGGTFGSMMSTPIINPPQSAILGMHAIKERPVVHAGQIVIRPMMYLALSYDHRLIDGKEAVSSLVLIKEVLEDPTRFLLEV